MSKHPMKKEGREVSVLQPDEPVETFRHASPFFSFSYSYSEISLQDGKARVKAHKTQLENGKVTSEKFEGTLDSSAYHAAAKQTQELFARQTQLMLDSFFRFLPWPRKRD
jgi:hypothetical protein